MSDVESMTEAVAVNDFTILIDEIQQIGDKLSHLHLRIRHRLCQSLAGDSLYQVSTIHALLEIQTTIKSLCDDLMNNQSTDPSSDVNHVWYIIESYSSSPETVVEGTHLLERYFKLKMYSIIKPTDYLHTIADY